MIRTLRGITFVALLATGLAAPAAAQEEPEPVQRFIVQVDATAAPEATLPPAEVTEQREAIADAQGDVAAALDEGEVVRDLAAVPFSVVEATPDEIARLQAEGLVSTAVPDLQLHILTDASRVMIGAPTVWPGGHDGSGRTIAILDSGVDRNHPFFGTIVPAADRACFADDEIIGGTGDCPNGQTSQTGANAAQPCGNADCDHGTHVAGIALADDNDGGVDYSGVAPEATLLPVQVFHDIDTGPGAGGISAWLSDILAGLNHVYALRSTHDIAAVNLSLGVGLHGGTCNNVDGGAIRATVANLTAAGIAVVAASGNDGSTTSMGFPACVTDVISVGNVLSTKSSNADNVSASSNASPSLDLLAPGSPITSAVPGGSTAVKSGTSMAAPHVAGSIALLRDARGDVPAAAERVRWAHGLLDATGVCITDPGNDITYRRIQVDVAVATTDAPSALFDDVPACSWYEGAVNWLLHEGLANGYGDNTFRGDLPITRAAVTNMLWNLYGAPDVAHEHTFTDGANWIEDALDWISDPAGPAAPEPLAAGYQNGTKFRPNNQITRGEVARMLWRAAGAPEGFTQPFDDVPPWLDLAVRWIADDPDDGGPLEPIATGYADDTFRDRNPITRAAVARMLQRFDAAVQP